MNPVLKFSLGLLKLPLLIQVWLGLLVLVNLAIPVFFWHRSEARLILGAFAVATVVMVVLTVLAGFTRLLGLGHFVWFPLPLLYYLWTRYRTMPCQRAVRLLCSCLDGVERCFSRHRVADVIRYMSGDRAELVTGL